MANIDTLLSKYGENHQHPTNVLIHRIAVPTILFCVMGFLWPVTFGGISIGILAAVGYFGFALRLSPRLAVAVGVELLICAILLHLLHRHTGAWFTPIVGGTFVVAWAGQFIGHGIEGKRPSFLEDLRFLLIGPLWTLSIQRKSP